MFSLFCQAGLSLALVIVPGCRADDDDQSAGEGEGEGEGDDTPQPIDGGDIDAPTPIEVPARLQLTVGPSDPIDCISFPIDEDSVFFAALDDAGDLLHLEGAGSVTRGHADAWDASSGTAILCVRTLDGPELDTVLTIGAPVADQNASGEVPGTVTTTLNLPGDQDCLDIDVGDGPALLTISNVSMTGDGCDTRELELVATTELFFDVDSEWIQGCQDDELSVGSGTIEVGSSRVDLQACKLEYSIVSPK